MMSFIGKLFGSTTMTKTTVTTSEYTGEKRLNMIDHLTKKGVIITRTPVQSKTVVASVEEVEKVEVTIAIDGDEIMIDDRVATIPQAIKDRGPLLINGEPNYLSFPSYRNNCIGVSYVSKEQVLVTFNGVRLTRKSSIEGWTRDKLIKHHQSIRDSAESDDENPTMVTIYQDLIIEFHADKDWLFLSVSLPSSQLAEPEPTIQIHQLNLNQLDSDAERLIIAFSYARAILLTLLSVNESIDNYNEDDLVEFILGLLL